MERQLRDSIEVFCNLYAESDSSEEREMAYLLQGSMMRIDEQQEKIQALQARIEQVEWERDKAIEDMETAESYQTWCVICKNAVGKSGCPIRYNGCKFEWRGTEGEQ